MLATRQPLGASQRRIFSRTWAGSRECARARPRRRPHAIERLGEWNSREGFDILFDDLVEALLACYCRGFRLQFNRRSPRPAAVV